MWCDDFDADLLRCVPGIEELFEPVAHLTLWTLCQPWGGKINSPAFWNGLGCLFWLQDEEPEYERRANGWLRLENGCSTDDPFVSCTPLEMARDLWCHAYPTTIMAPGKTIKLHADRLQGAMMGLMYHLRGQGTLVHRPPGMLRGIATEFWAAAVSDLRNLEMWCSEIEKEG